ncbi:cytochrome-b5 reductase [Acrasis kona]|uniref:Cytochrome-b5 reductase n=1 Tax=Acrasis kona TaxID=1008807 RepID=A0AAW2YM42_9EUKA
METVSHNHKHKEGRKDKSKKEEVDMSKLHLCKLISKVPLTKNVENPVALFRFQMPEGVTFGPTPIGQSITIFAQNNGMTLKRHYTPIVYEKDCFEVMVKLYGDGEFSPLVHAFKEGDEVYIKPPKKTKITIGHDEFSHVGMIAGGVGVAPMIPVLTYLLEHNTENLKLDLLFANKTTDDVIYKEMLDELSAKHKNLNVHYILSRAGDDWSGHRGRVDREYVSRYMPAPKEKAMVLICGSKQMKKDWVALLESMGYERNKNFFKF